VLHAIHLQDNRMDHIVADQLKARTADPLDDVAIVADEVVLESDHQLASLHQSTQQVGPYEDGAAGHQVVGARTKH
jgi:hypothetical protein